DVVVDRRALNRGGAARRSRRGRGDLREAQAGPVGAARMRPGRAGQLFPARTGGSGALVAVAGAAIRAENVVAASPAAHVVPVTTHLKGVGCHRSLFWHMSLSKVPNDRP